MNSQDTNSKKYSGIQARSGCSSDFRLLSERLPVELDSFSACRLRMCLLALNQRQCLVFAHKIQGELLTNHIAPLTVTSYLSVFIVQAKCLYSMFNIAADYARLSSEYEVVGGYVPTSIQLSTPWHLTG